MSQSASRSPYTRARDSAYEDVIGIPSEIFPSEPGVSPAVEIRRYHGAPAVRGPICDTWVTAGMSDVLWIDQDDEPLRRELIFYARPGGDYADALRTAARFPFEHETFLDFGHTIRVYGAWFLPNGAEALVSEDTSALTLPHLLFLSPLLRHHQRLSEALELDGTPVEFLWVVPISAGELELKKARGTSALLDVFQEHQHPWVFDPERRSYV